MKNNFQLRLMVAASALSVLAISTPVFAEESAARKKAKDNVAIRGYETAADRLNGAAKSTELVGMEVKNYQDEKLGKVEDLAVDIESGRVTQVILSVGGFIGIGDRLVGVPPGALHHDVAGKVLHLDADKAKLKEAPEFVITRWVEHSDGPYLTRIYTYYGQERAYNFVVSEAPDGTRVTTVNRAMIPAERLSRSQKASKLVGFPVRNLQDEKLGDVDNLLVDLPSGRILAVVVSSGGFLGLGDELSAIPSIALTFSADRKALVVDASKEMLSQAPHFKSNQWPDFTHPGYAGGIYRAYKVEPYFDVNAGAVVRDSKDSTPNALDQGNSKEDLNTTAQIRKDVLATEGFSVKAHNVRIITKNGNVTLKGTVESEYEKTRLGEIAARQVVGGVVDNQLEVKATNR